MWFVLGAGYSSAPNTDGINIGGHDIYVHDCFVHNGDDCIPTNTGPDDTDTYNVLVERVHCECGTNGGVLIVANNNSIHNVTFRDMTVVGTNQGAGVKISEAYSNATGVLHDCTWDNITVTMPRFAVTYVNVFQEDAPKCAQQPTPSRGDVWLTARNLTFSRVSGVIGPSAVAGCFLCAPGAPACEGLNWVDVVVTGVNGTVPTPYVCANVGVGDDEGSTPVPCVR